MELPERFQAFIRSHALLSDPSSTTLLAVSGGLDSIVMAHLFHASGLPFSIAHCNFQLRGAESDEEAEFVSLLAASLGTPIFIKRFETTAYAAEHGLSTQVAARELRYAWFNELSTQHGFSQIATAHHLNDSVETLVLHLARGTGIRGLHGIPAKNARVIRPLLFATRTEIRAFAEAKHIMWREDSSNAGDAYTRNFIRHRIIPLLEEINPGFLHAAEQTMSRMAELEAINTFLTSHWWSENSTTEPDGSVRIALDKLSGVPHPGHFLFIFLEQKGFTPEQCRQLAAGLQGEPGLEVRSEKFRALIDRKDLMISSLAPQKPIIQVQDDDLMVRLPDGSKLFLMPTDTALPYPDGQTAIVVEAEKLVFPLLLRGWEPGDVFQPFGMGGQSQKLQDFFTNLKLSRIEKDQTWLLINGDGTAIWVVGYRPDERFRVGSAGDKFLKISIL
ncbi:MAG TPA: tRNA lysidine(34) synthetase TilS [Saprospiraceae bacterium]|nr:tRNA lysidine(34) synthetase TilS [Saprospiraceae bacterium]HPI08583.1 tRNA lysidine(34) synthetase TilS [Saprospiraceae bacterium]